MTDQARDALKARVSIARSLRDIETLALDLHAQALATPNAKDFPGGTALHMLGPAAVIQDWEAEYERKEARERFDPVTGADRWEGPLTPKGEPTSNRNDPAVYHHEGDAAEHPLNVLCFWTRVIREDRDQPTQLSPTLSRETDYLRKSLDWACRVDEFGEPEWMQCFELQDDLTALVRRMEDVLHMGERSDLTRVPCINDKCETTPLLIKRRAKVGDQDRYVCPSCKQEYDQRQFIKAKEDSMRGSKAEKWVLATDATEFLEVPVQTMRSWIGREKVKTQWEDGRLYVWWPDAQERAEARRIEQFTKMAARPA